MKKWLLPFILLICSFQLSLAQDSIRIAREINRAEKTRNSNPDSSLIYADNVIKWATQPKNYYQLGRGTAQKGVFFHMKSMSDSALYYYFKAIEFYKKGNITHEHQVANINIGMIYEMRGNFDLALKYQLEAYQYFIPSGNQKFLNLAMRSIARIYSLTGDHAKAFPFFIKLYDSYRISSDSINLAHAVSDLGTVYTYLKDFEKARKFKLEAIERYTRNKDLPALGSCWQTLGNIEKFQGNFQMARNYYMSALDCYRKSEYPFGFAQTYYNLGCLEDTLNQTKPAISYYLKSIQLGKDIGDDQLCTLAEQNLAEAYAKSGNYKDAYLTFVSFNANAKKNMDSEKQKAITELETKFQTLQKDKEIEEQKNKITFQEYKLIRNRQYLYASLSLFAIFILMFFVWRSRNKIRELKLQETHNNDIQKQRMMAIIDSQEQERKRFTSDLHDSFGQLISILKININELADPTANSTINRFEKFQECKSAINDMYLELRNVVFDLMPQTLVNGGIRPALEEFAERINRSARLSVDTLFFESDERLASETEVAIYRICQEWINNILKYSDAKQITVQLTADDTELTLTIEDNGSGFDKNLLTQSKGNGWKNINSRSNLIHGVLDLETRPGTKGNLLILNVPLNVVSAGEKIPA
ncbi:MAG: tetratricopeptide repeat protein [Prolixibacteraceae bacterium]|jgi:signal transduction histidine kinase